MRKMIGRLGGLLCALALAACAAGFAAAETAEVPVFRTVQAAINWVKKNQPMTLEITGVKWTPSDLNKIKSLMPEGAEFRFSTSWGGVEVTDESVSLDLTGIRANPTGADLEGLISLCPNLAYVDNTGKRAPSFDVMSGIVDRNPRIRFDWNILLGHGHYVSTKDTAFSTFNEPFDPEYLTSRMLMKLKYCPQMKALDLGHNEITDLEFLQYVPDLEFLIIGDNKVKDLTPISQLKHVQYAELFSNYFTDITPLAECTELIDLNIRYARVTDFSCLDNLEHLERFWATMIRGLPDEEKERFMKVHPTVEVDFKGSHATTNGWRSHPRYKHYIWCLKNRTWIPFDQPLPTEQR